MRRMGILHEVVLASAAFILLSAGMAAASGTKEKQSTTSTGSQPVSLTLFVDQTWYPVKSWTGPVPDEITKVTGVKPEVTIATDAKQLPLMIASGSLPDLVATSTQNVRMDSSDVSYAWDELIKKYDPSFKINPERIAVNTAPDGHFYTIRNYFSTQSEWKTHEKYALNFTGGILVRSDIMKALGNPQVTSLDDLVSLLQSVKDKYPGMIPLVVNPPNWTKPYFANQFGVVQDFNVVNGKIVYDLDMPQYKSMYLYINSLYRKGFLTAENFTFKQDQQAVQLAATGKAFAIEWTTKALPTMNGDAKSAGNSFTFEYLPVKISDTFKQVDTSAGWQGTYITKNNKHPALSIKFEQFLASPEGQQLSMYGRKGVDWHWSADGGYPVFNYNYLDNNAQVKLGVIYWGLLGCTSATTELIANYDPGTPTTKINQELMKFETHSPALGLLVPSADSQEAVILANLKNMVQTEETKVFLAPTQAAASQAYDQMVAKADQIGLKTLVSWANGKYDKVIKLFR